MVSQTVKKKLTPDGKEKEVLHPYLDIVNDNKQCYTRSYADVEYFAYTPNVINWLKKELKDSMPPGKAFKFQKLFGFCL